jgi:hypothetical protein
MHKTLSTLDNAILFAGLVLLLVLLIYAYYLCGYLIYHIWKKHPAYYKEIGSPVFYTRDPRGIARQFRASKYLFVWTFGNLPSNLPNDKICKAVKHRQVMLKPYVRSMYIAAILCWLVGVIKIGF